MNPLLLLKILVPVLGIGALGGVLFYIKTIIAENAVLKNSVQAAAEYSIRLEDEVEAYSHAVAVLGDRDQKARDKRDEKFKNIEKRDLTKMSKRHPDSLLNILNARTDRMLDSIAEGSRSKNSRTTSSSKTGTN